jgi:DNA-binding LacI/PurR family transcriptional regulator/serine phosphatase RsbU (regulator of sigma subunit)
MRDALEHCARRHSCDLVAVLGRELEHTDLNERTQNVIFDWISPDSVDGVIALSGVLVNFAGSGALTRLLERLSPVPVVSVGVGLPGVKSITVDNRAGMRKAVQHLLERHGCTRVAYISGPPDNQEADARLQGYRDALLTHGLTPAPELVTYGRFTLPTGQDCMNELLARGCEMDAVAAANDYMALGAMDALRNRGIAVPKQMRVLGFDDSPLAGLSSRPLTSVAQPAEAMAERALEVLLEAIAGESSESLTVFSPQVVLRHSCGCGHVDQLWSTPPSSTRRSALEVVRSSPAALVDVLASFGVGAGQWWNLRCTELIQALERELRGEAEAFFHLVERLTEAAPEAGVSLDNLRRSITALKRTIGAASIDGAPGLERVWLSSLNAISEANRRAEGRASLDLFERFIDLRYSGQRLSMSLEADSIAAELERSLPLVGVTSACIALLDERHPDLLRPILILDERRARPGALGSYAKRELIPRDLFANERSSFVVMALTFETEVFGVFVVDGNASPLVCEMLRTQISAAMKLGRMQRRVIMETAARERSDQLHLEAEVAIAREIQTALSPKRHQVQHLDIAATMLPAKEVGGDYYDVIPVPGGAWLCIGDVTGHGLLSGLIMLMIQSMVTALARSRPNASPAELLVEVNQGLTPNIRERLGEAEHATMAVLRFFDDGAVSFAGSHEDLIVYRKHSGRCELVSTGGVWIGILDDIRKLTPDQHLRLEPDDILVLYTDGFIEARNAHGTLFGCERLCALIEAHAARGSVAIREEMLNSVLAWSALQQDDLTCLIARYEPGRS